MQPQNSMNCTEFEVLFCDHLDGTLGAAERARVEQHRAECAGCAAFAHDVEGGLELIGRAAQVEPPPALLARIAFEIPQTAEAHRARSWWVAWLGPVLQPRFAMGMAMTILSFSMLARFAGIEVRQLKPSDLHPASVWAAVDNRIHRAWERGVKYYENLRLVYEVQARLQELTEQEEEDRKIREAEGPAAPAAPDGESK